MLFYFFILTVRKNPFYRVLVSVGDNHITLTDERLRRCTPVHGYFLKQSLLRVSDLLLAFGKLKIKDVLQCCCVSIYVSSLSVKLQQPLCVGCWCRSQLTRDRPMCFFFRADTDYYKSRRLKYLLQK